MSTQPFILPRLIPGLSGNLVVKSKLPPRSGFSVEAVEPIHQKGPQRCFLYPKLLTGFGMLVVFTNLNHIEFQVRYFALFCLFSLIDSFEWFRMGSPHKIIQLMLEFLMAPFLVLHFSHNTLMTFLMMLSVILPSMLMILLCSKCDQASEVWQQLELASELESDLQDTVD